MHPILLALAIIVAGGTLPLLLHRYFLPAKFLHAALTVAGSIFGLSAILSPGPLEDLSWTWLYYCPLALAFDSLTLFFLVPILIICPLAAIYSVHYFNRPERSLRVAVSLFFTNILLVGMVLLTAADNMVSFALAWELVSIASYILVMYDYEKKTTRNAGYLYFIFTQTGALFIFASFGVIFGATGSLAFSGAAALPEHLKLVAFALAFIGFGSKAGVFPIHFWLPHAHPAAPSHISAIMSGVMIKMGIYGILRFYLLLVPSSAIVGQSVLVFGMISGVLGVLYALGKHDIKRLLAYHSVENIGIILIGLGLGMLGIALGDPLITLFAFAGGVLHVLNHALFKSLLFFGAGVVVQQCGTGQIDRLGGLMKKMPVTGSGFLVGSVSISGLPPFNGFISEFLIYFAAFAALQYHHSTFLLAILAILSLTLIGGLASFCFTKVVGIVFLGEPRSPEAMAAGAGGRLMQLPTALLAAACLLIGVFPAPWVDLAWSALSDFPVVGAVPLDRLTLVTGHLAFGCRLFLLIVLLMLLVRKLLYRHKPVARGATWGCGFTKATARIQYTGTSYARTVTGMFRPFVTVDETAVRLQQIFPERTTFTNHVSDIAETAATRGLALPLLRLLGKLRWIQHGNIQLYIGYIIVAILVVLLALMI
jgi:hydrogenase-4 component B